MLVESKCYRVGLVSMAIYAARESCHRKRLGHVFSLAIAIEASAVHTMTRHRRGKASGLGSYRRRRLLKRIVQLLIILNSLSGSSVI